MKHARVFLIFIAAALAVWACGGVYSGFDRDETVPDAPFIAIPSKTYYDLYESFNPDTDLTVFLTTSGSMRQVPTSQTDIYVSGASDYQFTLTGNQSVRVTYKPDTSLTYSYTVRVGSTGGGDTGSSGGGTIFIPIGPFE